MKDSKGNNVSVGDIVKVLHIDEKFIPDKDELEKVKSMIGEELEVDEIDDFGCAWVTKWFPTNTDETEGHGVSLESNQIELISRKS